MYNRKNMNHVVCSKPCKAQNDKPCEIWWGSKISYHINHQENKTKDEEV
jgi:hypothetical protein